MMKGLDVESVELLLSREGFIINEVTAVPSSLSSSGSFRVAVSPDESIPSPPLANDFIVLASIVRICCE